MDDHTAAVYHSQMFFHDLEVDVQVFSNGPSRTMITAKAFGKFEEPREIEFILSERDTKRLAIQLLMGVL